VSVRDQDSSNDEEQTTSEVEDRSNSDASATDEGDSSEDEDNNQGESLRECTICAESLSEQSFHSAHSTKNIPHFQECCKTCISQHLATQISTRQWNQISCIMCSMLLDYKIIRQFAGEESFVEYVASCPLLHATKSSILSYHSIILTRPYRYEKKCLLATISFLLNFQACLNPKCDSGQLHEGGEENPIMTCINCGYKMCFVHRLRRHDGLTCKQFDKQRQRRQGAEEPATWKLSSRTAQRCPGCTTLVNKIDGCDKMTCELLPFFPLTRPSELRD
jgi:hypothetical protein